MNRKIRESLFITQCVFLLLVSVICVLGYCLFATTYYEYQKSKLIEAAYMDLKGADLTMLAEDDQSMLKEYESEDLLFTITDEDFNLLYSTWSGSSERQVYRHILLHEEEFSENPEVIRRETRNPTAVKLLGLIEQEGKMYYVNIREQSFSAYDSFIYTGKFLLIVFFAAIVLGLPVLYLYSGRIVRQLNEINDTISKFISRDFSGRISENGPYQEFNDLAGNINQIAGQIQEYQEKKGTTKGQKDLLDDIRRDVVADLSHELKTPLAIISSQVEMLQCMGEQVDRDYYYTSIVEEVSRMSDMVENLMNLSLMDHQIQQMQRQEMDLADTVEYIRLKYQALFQQNHIKGDFSVEEGCWVCGNAHYLELAIDNYLMNAFSHTAQGNHICVRLYRQQGWVWLTVYNQGKTIKPSDMEQIWKIYVMKRQRQQNAAPASSMNGLEEKHVGMGLYLVRRIIRLHQGECGVKNQEKGVEFWFKIPENAGAEQSGTFTTEN